MTGLLVSALVPNQNAALIVVIAVLVPQFLFTGVLLPLKQIPGGEIVSLIVPTRWSFEGFVRSTKLGEVLASDPCWSLPVEQRDKMTDEEKDKCSCMGSHLFERCTDIPGLFSTSFYTDEAKAALAGNQPEKPVEPESLPTFTPYPSPTPLATFTPMPTFTPIPPVGVGPYKDLASYMTANTNQMEEYFTLRSEQEEEFGNLTKDQLNGYLDQRQDQGEQMTEESKDQFSTYVDNLEIYGDQKSDWDKNRQKAISGAEMLIKMFIDDFRPSVEGSVFTRWYFLIGLNIGMFLIILLMQKRKDNK